MRDEARRFREYADELHEKLQAAEKRAEEAEREKTAAIHEMAKARGLAQDAQSRYDWLCYGQHVEAEERGGEFQRLYLKLQAALQRVEQARAEGYARGLREGQAELGYVDQAKGATR